MSETDLSRSIQKSLNSMGYVVIRMQSGTIPLRGRFIHCAEKGTPDLLVLGMGGATTWIECKATDGRLSDDQREWHARALRMGHSVVVARSVREAVEGVRG